MLYIFKIISELFVVFGNWSHPVWLVQSVITNNPHLNFWLKAQMTALQ